MARAEHQEVKATAITARAQLLPQLNFTEDISRGNDPVYVFGSRLRQRQFTQSDFELNALNSPQPLGNFSTRFTGTWIGFDSFRTQREIRSADLLGKVPPRRPRQRISRLFSALLRRTNKCCMHSGRSMLRSMSRRQRLRF